MKGERRAGIQEKVIIRVCMITAALWIMATVLPNLRYLWIGRWAICRTIRCTCFSFCSVDSKSSYWIHLNIQMQMILKKCHWFALYVCVVCSVFISLYLSHCMQRLVWHMVKLTYIPTPYSPTPPSPSLGSILPLYFFLFLDTCQVLQTIIWLNLIKFSYWLLIKGNFLQDFISIFYHVTRK